MEFPETKTTTKAPHFEKKNLALFVSKGTPNETLLLISLNLLSIKFIDPLNINTRLKEFEHSLKIIRKITYKIYLYSEKNK